MREHTMCFQTRRTAARLADGVPKRIHATGRLTFSKPKNLSLPSARTGPALTSSFSRGVASGALASFLMGMVPGAGLKGGWDARQYGGIAEGPGGGDMGRDGLTAPDLMRLKKEVMAGVSGGRGRRRRRRVSVGELGRVCDGGRRRSSGRGGERAQRVLAGRGQHGETSGAGVSEGRGGRGGGGVLGERQAGRRWAVAGRAGRAGAEGKAWTDTDVGLNRTGRGGQREAGQFPTTRHPRPRHEETGTELALAASKTNAAATSSPTQCTRAQQQPATAAGGARCRRTCTEQSAAAVPTYVPVARPPRDTGPTHHHHQHHDDAGGEEGEHDGGEGNSGPPPSALGSRARTTQAQAPRLARSRGACWRQSPAAHWPAPRQASSAFPVRWFVTGISPALLPPPTAHTHTHQHSDSHDTTALDWHPHPHHRQLPPSPSPPLLLLRRGCCGLVSSTSPLFSFLFASSLSWSQHTAIDVTRHTSAPACSHHETSFPSLCTMQLRLPHSEQPSNASSQPPPIRASINYSPSIATRTQHSTTPPPSQLRPPTPPKDTKPPTNTHKC